MNIGPEASLIPEAKAITVLKVATLSEAVAICEKSYLDDLRDSEGMNNDKEYERTYYHEKVLQSCKLVGELKN
jgi:hypothetical protein